MKNQTTKKVVTVCVLWKKIILMRKNYSGRRHGLYAHAQIKAVLVMNNKGAFLFMLNHHFFKAMLSNQ